MVTSAPEAPVRVVNVLVLAVTALPARSVAAVVTLQAVDVPNANDAVGL